MYVEARVNLSWGHLKVASLVILQRVCVCLDRICLFYLELSNSARLAGQGALGVHWVLLSQHWDFKSVSAHPAFLCELLGRNPGSHTCRVNTLLNEPPLNLASPPYKVLSRECYHTTEC